MFGWFGLVSEQFNALNSFTGFGGCAPESGRARYGARGDEARAKGPEEPCPPAAFAQPAPGRIPGRIWEGWQQGKRQVWQRRGFQRRGELVGQAREDRDMAVVTPDRRRLA